MGGALGLWDFWWRRGGRALGLGVGTGLGGEIGLEGARKRERDRGGCGLVFYFFFPLAWCVALLPGCYCLGGVSFVVCGTVDVRLRPRSLFFLHLQYASFSRHPSPSRLVSTTSAPPRVSATSATTPARTSHGATKVAAARRMHIMLVHAQRHALPRSRVRAQEWGRAGGGALQRGGEAPLQLAAPLGGNGGHGSRA